MVSYSAVVIAMEVVRVCWFARRSRGNTAWFREKYVYNFIDGDIGQAS